MLKHIIGAYLIAITLVLVPLHADDRIMADQQFASISRLLEQADQAFETHALPDADRLYGATVRAYEQFVQTFPTFAPDLVRFRIAYCRNQMALIRQRIVRTPDTSPPTASGLTPPPKPLALPPGILDVLQGDDRAPMLSAYQRLVENEDPAAPLLRAALYVKDGDISTARDTLESFLTVFPTEPAAHYNMAQLILRDDQPDFEKARQHYRKAIKGGATRDEDLEIVINF